MKQYTWVLAVVISVATVLWISTKREEPSDQRSAPGSPVEAQTTAIPDRPDATPYARTPEKESPDSEESAANATAQEDCAIVIGQAETWLKQYDQRRLREITLEDEDLEAYRGLDAPQLEHLAAQGDAQAMALMAITTLISEVAGLDAADSVPLIRGEVDTRGLEPDQEALDRMLSNPEIFINAANWMYESAVHGRLEVFKEIGEPLQIGKLTAVDLGWVNAGYFDSLSEERQRMLRPDKVYETAYFLIDPALLESGRESYEEWLDRQKSQWGPLLETVVRPIADDFVNDVNMRGFTLPELEPSITVAEFLEARGCHSE